MVLVEVLVEGEQAGLDHENVIAGLHGNEVHATRDKPTDLLRVAADEVLKSHRALTRRGTRLDVQGLVGGTHAAGDKARPVGSAPGPVVHARSRQLRTKL